MNLQSLEDAEFFDQVNTGEVQAFLNDWTWDNGDPDNVMYSCSRTSARSPAWDTRTRRSTNSTWRRR